MLTIPIKVEREGHSCSVSNPKSGCFPSQSRSLNRVVIPCKDSIFFLVKWGKNSIMGAGFGAKGVFVTVDLLGIVCTDGGDLEQLP